jgi:myo-inositol-1(or 4)-monophosphatase
MTKTTNQRLEFTKALAQEAAELGVKLRAEHGEDFISEKGTQDFVTFADQALEDLIRARLTEAFPEDSILGEESGLSGDGAGYWVIDPIDGTANYMRGMPEWGVCIAYYDGTDILCGVVSAPDMNMLCWASKGGGAWMNGKRLQVSDCSEPTRSVLTLGWSSRRPTTHHTQLVGTLLENGMEYRRNGSCCISMLTVAPGRTEGYFELHVNAWDAFAAIPIITEAGGLVQSDPLDQFVKQGSVILATCPGMTEPFSEATDITRWAAE